MKQTENNQPLHKHTTKSRVVSQSTQGPTLQGEESTKIQLWQLLCFLIETVQNQCAGTAYRADGAYVLYHN
jgi:hypothetical protein